MGEAAFSSTDGAPAVIPLPGGISPPGFSVIFGSSVLTLLFWATLLSFMGYGAFDPLESLFYRDVLNVGAEWMGWLSALSGVGGLIGAALAGVMPPRLINVRALLVVLCITGSVACCTLPRPSYLSRALGNSYSVSRSRIRPH